MEQRKRPPVPRPRGESVRRALRELLSHSTLSARDISAILGIPEKEVYGHLAHLRRSLHGGGIRFHLVPALCRQCGFVFSKRERPTKPGKCPQCRATAIQPPEFRIE